MNPEILIYGPIGSGGVTAEQFALKLKAAGSGPVTVRVNSPGGDAFDGLAIYNLIKAHGNVMVIIDGLAASAAGYAVLGAKRVEMAKDALLMIHPPHSEASGESDDLRETADLLDRTEKQIAAIYSRRTGKTSAQVGAWLTGETWFTADEAKAAGLIDEISPDALARLGIKLEYSYAFKSAPAAIAARFKTAPAVEIDPIKARLAVLESEVGARIVAEKIGNGLDGFLEPKLRASIIQFAASNEGMAAPLILALKERKELQAKIQQMNEEMRAVMLAGQCLIPVTAAKVNPEYDAYMTRLKNSRT